MDAIVVNRRVEPEEVYIGRGSRWGNPFSHKTGTQAQFLVSTREEAVECYRRHLWKQIKNGEITLQQLAELHGKRLGCYCKPQACHGDVLVKAARWAHDQLSPNVIDKFDGDYRFLSNFYPAHIEYGGLQFNSVEHAYQAAKCRDRRVMMLFQNITPGQAKRLGREVEIREDWDDVKLLVMRNLVFQKFYDDPDLAAQLLATGDAELIEGNTWGDTYWGVCNGVGENHLGQILMAVRAKLEAMG